MKGVNLQQDLSVMVRKRRTALGLSQEGLADLCGLHRTYVGAIERGERNITLKTLSALALALDISSLELLKSDTE
ncbi:MAG: helix-turn-helix transcriptional regulator [Pseudomonadota bacterium]